MKPPDLLEVGMHHRVRMWTGHHGEVSTDRDFTRDRIIGKEEFRWKRGRQWKMRTRADWWRRRLQVYAMVEPGRLLHHADP